MTGRDEDETRERCVRQQIPFVNLSQNGVPPEILDLVSAEIAHRWEVIPVAIQDDELVLATADGEEALSRVIDASIDLRRPCRPALATRSAVRAKLVEYYGEPKPVD